MRLAQNGMKNVDRGFPAKRQAASQTFIEQHAEGEDVAAGICGLAAKLFRGHVRNSAAGSVLCGSAGDEGFFGLTNCALASSEGRQAKVENLHSGLGVQHDVGRLDVAMIDARSVRFVQPLGDLTGDIQQLLRRQSAAL